MKKLVRCPLQLASFLFSPGFLRVCSLFSSRFQRSELDAGAASGVVNLSLQTILKGKRAWSSGICLVSCTSKRPRSLPPAGFQPADPPDRLRLRHLHAGVPSTRLLCRHFAFRPQFRPAASLARLLFTLFPLPSRSFLQFFCLPFLLYLSPPPFCVQCSGRWPALFGGTPIPSVRSSAPPRPSPACSSP